MFSLFRQEQGGSSGRSGRDEASSHRRGLRSLGLAALTVLGALVSFASIAGDTEQGKTLYDQYCTGCHGSSGQGGRKNGFMPRPQNLTKKGYIELLPDAYLFTVISKGGAAVGKSDYMPAFESTFEKENIESLIAYIRTLTPH